MSIASGLLRKCNLELVETSEFDPASVKRVVRGRPKRKRWLALSDWTTSSTALHKY